MLKKMDESFRLFKQLHFQKFNTGIVHFHYVKLLVTRNNAVEAEFDDGETK